MSKDKEKQFDCVECFEAYGQCRVSRRIAVLKKQVKGLTKENEQIKSSDTLCKLIGEQKLKINYAKTIIQDLLDNSDEYARQRAIDFLKGD